MRLTLPFEGAPIALPIPSAMWRVNGKWAGFHEVTPAASEIPSLDISNCTRCGVLKDTQIRSCESPVCPSRDRKAA
jgi:hypothetical protein